MYGSSPSGDLFEKSGVVNVVQTTSTDVDPLSLFAGNPEWVGRVRVVVMSLRYVDDMYHGSYYSDFKVFDGSSLVRQGTFHDQVCAYREFQSKDWYICSHKVLWKGLLAERELETDVNALLAGNDVGVSSSCC
jgi:hypothetical protein